MLNPGQTPAEQARRMRQRKHYEAALELISVLVRANARFDVYEDEDTGGRYLAITISDGLGKVATASFPSANADTDTIHLEEI